MPDTLVETTDVQVISSLCPTTAVTGPRELIGQQSFEVVLVRSGSFSYRDRRGRVSVDSTTAVLGAPGQLAEIAHPAPGGDLDTLISLSREVWHSLTHDDHVPLSVPVPPPLLVTQHRILAGARSGVDGLTLEEATLGLVAALVAQVEPRRLGVGRVRAERAGRDLVAHTQVILATDPTVSTVREIAVHVGCSPHHLSRVFRSHTGTTLGWYRMQLRVNLALELLTSTSSSIADIAAMSGFSDHAHLTRTLRRHLGSTPSGLRADLGTQRRPD